MIRIFLGNVGSGKTVAAVREMYINDSERLTYSNIKTKLKNQINISPDMIIKKTVTKYVTRKNGEKEPVYEYKLNSDYWKNIKEPINICIDEAHSILNSRRSFSKINVIVTDFLALARRILGHSDSGYGDFTLISQLPNRLDVICRDMATQIRYHICHYQKRCKKCGTTWTENSEMPESLYRCPRCLNLRLKIFGHALEIWHFSDMNKFNCWKDFGQKTFYKHYLVRDIATFFPLYNTLEWDNMFSEYY